MTNVLESGIIAIVLTIGLGPLAIRVLRHFRIGQNIRAEDFLEGHQTKQGTPTMGGLLIIGCAALAFLPFAVTHPQARSFGVLFALVGCGAVGALDDYLKVVKQRSLGLNAKWKLAGLGAVSVVIALIAYQQDLSTDVFIPLLHIHIDLGVGWYVLIFVMVLAASNTVNLTDGLDGLAGGSTVFAMLAYTAMMVVAYQVTTPNGPCGPKLRNPQDNPALCFVPIDQLRAHSEYLDLAIIAAALLGACAGFLWFNAFPADVFMGDTGSLALGGAVAAFAIFTKTELLLPVIGGIFVLEGLSVILQVISFRRFGKRIFLMAPIHHHFEMKAWSETKIMVRFWILGAMFAASGFVAYFLNFSNFR